MKLNPNVVRLIDRLYGCAFSAKLDAEALFTMCEENISSSFYAKVNRENIGELYLLVKELYEVSLHVGDMVAEDDDDRFASQFVPF